MADWQASVQGHKFGVLHIHNLQETLKKKGVDFPNACQILEICNPQSAKEVLTEDMDLNMALPCRVSVYSEDGKTKIGMMKPSAMLKMLSDSPGLSRVARWSVGRTETRRELLMPKTFMVHLWSSNCF